MSDTLLLRLASVAAHNPEPDQAPTQPQWLLVDGVGGRMGIVLSGDLAEAAALAVGRKVIALVPGTEVHLASPTLPVKRGAQLEQVMRYALEENLASDIDDLHFAMGKRQLDGSTPVAVVGHPQMAAWQQRLAAAGIAVDALYSEADVLPALSGMSVVIDAGMLYVKRSASVGAALDVHPIGDALQLVLGDLTSNDATPIDVCVYVHQDEYEASIQALDTLRERLPHLQTKLLPEGPLPLFAAEATKGNAINLLSGQYARKKSWNTALAPWRIAAVLACVGVLLHLSVSGLQFWQLTRAEKKVDQQLRELVAQTLPGIEISDTRKARQQFETQLQALRAGGSSEGLLSSLNALSETMAQLPDARIDALAYRPKVIDLRVTAPSVDSLARMQQLVNEQGLHAEIQSATPRDNKVEGRLQVKSPGA